LSETERITLIPNEDIQKLKNMIALYTKLTVIRDIRKSRVKFILCAGRDKVERTIGFRHRSDIAFADLNRIARDLGKDLISCSTPLTNLNDIYSIQI